MAAARDFLIENETINHRGRQRKTKLKLVFLILGFPLCASVSSVAKRSWKRPFEAAEATPTPKARGKRAKARRIPGALTSGTLPRSDRGWRA
jgi:hypothetical protein